MYSQRDTSKVFLIQSDFEDIILKKELNRSNNDTLLDNIQNSLHRNLLGNVGLPTYNLNPGINNYNCNDIGVRLKPLLYSNTLTPSGKIFQETKNIYTSIFASAGLKKEQVLFLSHAHRLNNRNNFTLLFNRYSSEGFYQNQLSFVNDLMITAFGNGKKNNSGYYSYFSFQKIKHQDNGGIESDSAFNADPSIRKDLLNVNLEDAKRLNRNFSFSLQPWFKLGRKDSSHNNNQFIHINSSFEKILSQYQDSPLDNFYDYVFKDSLITNDSISLLKWKNELFYRFDFLKNQFKLFLGFRHDYSEYFNAENKFFQNNFVLNQALYYSKSTQNLFISEKFQFVVEGFSKGDFLLNLKGEKHAKTFILGIQSSLDKRTPDLFYFNFSGNNFSWSNKLKKSEAINFNLNVLSSKWNVGMNVYSRISRNDILLNSNSLPFQYQEFISWTKFEFFKKIKFFKFHANSNIAYNLILNKDLIRQPEWLLNSSVYFEDLLYKGNLLLQIGFQMNYWSQFSPYGYNPSLNLFYLQNTIQNYGYLFADFFVNAKIDQVSLFLKLDHLNQGFSGTNYFLTSHYFQNDRMIRFGLKWIFTN